MIQPLSIVRVFELVCKFFKFLINDNDLMDYFEELVHFSCLACKLIDSIILLLDLALGNVTHERKVFDSSL